MPETTDLMSCIGPPFVHYFAGSRANACQVAWNINKGGVDVARVLRGKYMVDIKGRFREVAAALQFPWYFGENMNALHECLDDLEWLPARGRMIVIDNANLVLSEGIDDRERGELIASIFVRAGEEWAAPITWEEPGRDPAPFHVVLQETPDQIPRLLRMLRQTGIECDEVTSP